ncbi:hypothetical protein HZS_7326, partial [Henneguya salminicola]
MWFILMALYSNRINLTIAIIGMITAKTSTKNFTDSCPSLRNKGSSYVDTMTSKFTWDEALQQYVLSAFSFGYMLSHIPLMLLSIAIGPGKIMSICLMISTIFTFLSIIAAKNEYFFMLTRGIIGFSNGQLYSFLQQIIVNYSPPNERGYALSLTQTGNIGSIAITFLIGGYILEYVIDGWKYIFIMTGSFAAVAWVLWNVFVTAQPSENAWMSILEKDYIMKRLYPNGQPPPLTLSTIPFRKIFTSPQIYLLSLVHFGKLLIMNNTLLGGVKYLYDYYNLSRFNAGNYAVIIFAVDFLLHFAYPLVVKFLTFRGWKTTNIRRFNTLVGAMGASGFLIAAGFIPCSNPILGLVTLGMSLWFIIPYQFGYFPNISDVGPRYSMVTMSIVNVLGSFSGVAQRYLTGFLMKQFPSNLRLAYRYSFIITGIVALITSMPYVFFGSSEIQPWAVTPSKPNPTILLPSSADKEVITDSNESALK